MNADKNLKFVHKKSFCGISFYEKYRSDTRLVRIFASGLLREEVNYSAFGEVSRQFYFLGIKLFKREVFNNIVTLTLFGNLNFLKFDIAKVVEKEFNHIFGITSQNCKDKRAALVLWANSGEVALFLEFFMPRFIADQNLLSQEVVFLCTKQYHSDMVALFYPNFRAVVAKPKVLRFLQNDLKTESWDVKILFPGYYFSGFEKQFRNSDNPMNHFVWMSKFLKSANSLGSLPSDLNERLDCFEKEANKKVSGDIDFGKTVIISSNSVSCGCFSVDEISAIYDLAIQFGYSVFFNESNGVYSLTFPELLSKARKAAGIIGIRSGLFDFLNCIEVPKLVCYKNFIDRGFNTPAVPAVVAKEMFSLTNFGEYSYVTEVIAEPRLDLYEVKLWFEALKARKVTRAFLA